ncbi:hypothetical protein PSHT_07088 [Puccinia striiformis]|uniref:MULE transposase domain-containing protein n=1 Tax=Puccinia striiformis TaxID=27350 RepID=A0A2S4W0X2_9BASI|nr:hypothetical protein PSHT_07088 [Puccinia striiformis]
MSGVTVPPEVWAQMQQLLAAFAPSASTNSTVTTKAPAPLTPLTAPSIIGSEPLPSPAPLSDSLPPTTPSNWLTRSVSLSELPAVEDIASLSLPDESVEDHLLNGVPGSLHVENNNDFPHPSEAVTATGKELVQSILTLIIDINGYDYTTGGPLAPPPAAQFKSMDDLFLFCKNWSKPHGYAVAKANSHAGKNVYIRCDRGGEFQGAVLNESGRQTATSKIDCPFRLKGSVPTSQKILNKLWTLEIRNADHNHGPSASPLAHASHRALLPEQYEEIRRLSQSNLKPAQILLQTPIEALLCILKETNWLWDIKTTSTGQVQNLFFTHPGSIHLARINHHVALLDSTYKTNKYKLPLLHVIGQAASNQSFSIAFCFLTYEDDENYLWAVNNLKKHIWRPQRTPKVFITDRDAALRKALSVVFPDSQANLCTWHLNKNIATNCKKNFGSATTEDGWDNFMVLWNKVTYSKTADIYVDRLRELESFLATRPVVLEYLKSSILPVKELFVVAWACQYAHLRNLNTSRVESGHAYLKTFINSSTGDLLSVFKSLGLAVDSQINHVHESIGRKTVKTLVNVPKSFIPILGYISTFAIKEFTIGIGIPCAHKIKEILEAGESLSPEDFHDQWHLRYNPEYTHDDEPELDFDKEMRNLTISLTNEQPETQARLLEQIKKIAAGTHNAVPIQDPATEATRKSKRVKKDASAPNDDSDAEESPSDSSYNIDQESHHSDGVHLALEDVISHNFDEAESTHGENVERSSSDEDADPSPDDEGAVTAEDIAYSSQVPQHLKHYITKIFDPLAGGNCGFRCLAQALGYVDNRWLRVRNELIAKIKDHKASYLKLQGGDESINKIIDNLDVGSVEAIIARSQWLDKLAPGQANHQCLCPTGGLPLPRSKSLLSSGPVQSKGFSRS